MLRSLSKNAYLALLGAVVLHLALLLIQFSFELQTLDADNELSITLLNEQPVEKLETPKPRKQEPKKQEPKKQELDKPSTNPRSSIQPRPAPTIDNVIVAQPSDQKNEQPKVSLNLSTNSDQFKKFLRNETDSYTSANPESLESFEQTFTPSTTAVTEVSPSSKSSQRQMRRTGVGMSQDKNGKRTCFAQIPGLNSDFETPQLLSKDCTPPKKFNLDLDKPRNN